MKLQCKVCHESPIVKVVKEPNFSQDCIYCPSCGKTMAYATENRFRNKLTWKPIDTDFNKEIGITPIIVISL